MRRFRFTSLRYRLLLLVLVALLPAFGLILSTAWEQRRQAVARAQDDALRLARLAATNHERLVEGARSLLTGLAQLSAVQMHDARACSALFAAVQRQFPLYTNLGAIRPDGVVFCSARPLPGPRALADKPSVERTLATREFTVGRYLASRASSTPVITLSYPAVDGSGAAWAVVFAELDLDWVSQLADLARLPEGSVISVIDAGSGLVLARHPDPGKWVGRSAPDSPLVRAIRREPGESTVDTPELDGTAHLMAFTPLFGPNRAESVYVSVGIPRHAVLGEADRLLARNLLWTGLVIVLVLTAAALVSDLFVLRRVHAVVNAAQRLSAGDLSARADVRSADEIGIMAGTFNTMAERLEERVREEQEVKAGLAERVSELDLLNNMGELLQACLTLGEAYGVTRSLIGRLFPTESGTVFALSASKTLLEPKATWGPSSADGVFPPDKCWALRKGQPHLVEDTGSGVLCEHLPSPAPPAYLCTPLVAQGKALGILYVSAEPGSGTGARGLTQAKQHLAEAVAAQLALGLANIELRDLLRSQSIRDPLTGLFNRRYMEETLEREVHRARRNKRSMAILMLDLDRFKQQNDTFGHDAGDAVLREVCLLVQGSLRREDIACRYGGEELVLVLPDASLDDAARRADGLRDAVKRLVVSHKGQTIGPVSVSIGVAAFPDHGADGDGVLRAADAALYRAKREGRDRVTVATAGDGAAPLGGAGLRG